LEKKLLGDQMSENYVHLYTTTLSIRWSDCDMLQHVNNVNFFRYFEEARIEWIISLRSKGFKNFSCVVAATDCVFLKPITFPSNLEIKIFGGDAGNKSMVTRTELYVSGVLHAKGNTTLVFVNPETGDSVTIPEDIRQMIPAKEKRLP
jgi:acyl-CoA thioester hydrolase